MRKIIDTNLIKSSFKDWLKILVFLLDDAAVIALAIIILRFLDVKIPLAITIFIGLLVGTFIFLIHVAVIPTFHFKQVTGREGMIGLQCRAVKPLTPTGVVLVKGEYWKAKCIDGNIEVDENMEVVRVAGLTLIVKRQDS